MVVVLTDVVMSDLARAVLVRLARVSRFRGFLRLVVIFFLYFNYLDVKSVSLIIPFSSSNQLAQNVRESGQRLA